MTKRFRFALAGAIALTSLEILWLTTKLGGEHATTAFSDLVDVPVTVAVAAASWIRARRESGGARRGWMLLGASVLSWGLGETIWSWYELVLGVEVPFPSAADIGYLGMIPLAGAALLSFPAGPATLSSRLRTVLDGFVIASAILFVSWATVLGDFARERSGGVVEQILSLSYPLGDAGLIVIVVFVVSRAGRGRMPLVLISLGLMSLAVADTGFMFLTQHDAYASGNLIDVGWTVGFLVIGLAVVAPSHPPVRSAERPGDTAVILPFVPVFVAVVAAGVKFVADGALEPVLFWNACAIVLAVVVRQLLLLRDNVSLNRTLERQVRDRTAELEGAVRDLAAARTLQDAFVANVSHELRTPLTSMIGAAATLRRPELGLGDRALQFVGVAERATTRMSTLVEDLLAASGIDVTGINLRRDVFDVVAEIEQSIATLDPQARRVRSALPETALALGDRQRTRLIVDGLLENARKFAPEESTVHVTAQVCGDCVEITVRDEGEGIADELRERVFERFFQADGGDTRRHGGVGLGLYLARRLTEAMGGSLTLHPPSTFRISLPSAAQSTPSQSLRSPAAGSSCTRDSTSSTIVGRVAVS